MLSAYPESLASFVVCRHCAYQSDLSAAIVHSGYGLMLQRDCQHGAHLLKSHEASGALLSDLSHLREIRAKVGAYAHLIAVLERDEPGVVEAAMAAGANDYITPPFPPHQLKVKLALAARWHAAHTAWDKERHHLEREGYTDPLTGLANRREFERAFRQMTHPAAMILLDIDHFKPYNDAYGHAEGDNALQHFSNILIQRVRRTDVAARIGGEEFAILAQGMNHSQAYRRAILIQQAIRAYPWPLRPITASIGVAVREPDEALSHWYMRADRALYEAKSCGRDCIKKAPNLA